MPYNKKKKTDDIILDWSIFIGPGPLKRGVYGYYGNSFSSLGVSIPSL